MRTLAIAGILSWCAFNLAVALPARAACPDGFETVTVGRDFGTGVTIQTCKDDVANTFTVKLPVVTHTFGSDCCGSTEFGVEDELTVPNGRPIYAILVSGYGGNKDLDQLYYHDFAYYLMKPRPGDERGAYVHWSWWNNLLKAYLAGPLHHALGQSNPGTGNVAEVVCGAASTTVRKATPHEDYQFQEDALRYLAAIRYHNPSAQIIVVGHSMGGGSVARLGTKAGEAGIVIDLLAPIDPVGNRSLPPRGGTDPGYCWTRFRAGHLWDYGDGNTNLNPLTDPIPRRSFGPNIINLYHTWQTENVFPFDYPDEMKFLPEVVNRAANTFWIQEEDTGICTSAFGCGGVNPPCNEDVRFPRLSNPPFGWLPYPVCSGLDGHGEIIGQFIWGTALLPIGITPKPKWLGNSAPVRKQKLLEMEQAAVDGKAEWEGQPTFDDWLPDPYKYSDDPQTRGIGAGRLCRVSAPLKQRVAAWNRPPVAVARDLFWVDSSVHSKVTLDGSGSSDPDGNDDIQTYRWEGPFTSPASGVTTGINADVVLPVGRWPVTLTVIDKARHVSKKQVEVIFAPPPDLTIGVLQNPYLTQFIDIFVTASSALEPSSVSLKVAGNPVPAKLTDSKNSVWRGEYKLVGAGTLQIEFCATTTLGVPNCAAASFAAFSVTASNPVTIESADRQFRMRISGGTIKNDGFVVVMSSLSAQPLVSQEAGDSRTVIASYRVSPAPLFDGGASTVEFDVADLTLPEGTEMSELVINAGGKDLTSIIDPQNHVIRANGTGAGEYRLLRGAPGSSTIADPSFVRLDPNYPNPFNPATTIRFEIQTSQRIRLAVYDVAGRLVRTLVDQDVPAGQHRIGWDGRSDEGKEVPSGVYFAQIRTSSRTMSHKLVLVR